MDEVSSGDAAMFKTFVVLGATLCAVLAFGGAAHAQTSSPLHALPIKGLHWLRKPSGEDIAAAYPQRAKDQAVSGRILLECQTTAGGSFSSCTILSVAPDDFGFGEAALKLSRLFRLDPKQDGVVLEGGVIQIPIILLAPGGKPAPLATALAGDPAVLITLAQGKEGFPCATPNAPAQRCVGHPFAWDARPTLEETAALVRGATGDHEVTSLTCIATPEQRLANCAAGGEPSSQQDVAMRGLVALMTPPVLALDKTPMANGSVMVEFHWPALRQTLDISVLTRR
jgi:TonB family protein